MRSSIRKGRRTTLRFSRQLCKIVFACATACFYSLPINYHRVVFAQTTCTQPPLLGRQWTWPQNSDVTVNISGAFGDPTNPNSLASCIRSAFVNWASNPDTAAGVRYNFNFNATPSGGTNTIWVGRTIPIDPDTGAPVQARVDPTFNSTNTNLQAAVVRIHPDVTNCTAIAEAMAHEIGHMYGLDDCNGCANGTSTMTDANGMNDVTRGTNSPTNCDAQRSRQAGTYDPNTARAPQPRQETNPGYSGGYNNQPFQGYYGPYNRQCYAAFMVTNWYSCGSSGCTYLYSTSSFMGINCY
ncbi:MAG TPA: hypothetical protein VF290_09650 [Pyrinomonadaceae bacterium]